MSEPLEVTLPSDLVQWNRVRSLLEELRSSISTCSSKKRTSILICHLYNARHLILNPNYQPLLIPFYVKRGWYLGVGRFLEECIIPEERDHFFETTLPSIIQLVLNLDYYRPTAPLSYCVRQKEMQISLTRGFIASLVGAAFLCLFPDHHFTMVENMNEFNFRALFADVNSQRTFQAQKLRCFLNYFDQVMMMSASQLNEPVTFRRCVLNTSQLLSHESMLRAVKPLCSFRLEPKESMDKASAQLIHIDFANSYIGGGTLRSGAAQEEIKFVECPELLAALLFMECMDDNEAITMSGYRTFNRFSGYSRSFHFQGSVTHSKMWCQTPMLCAIDAIPYNSWYKEEQYYTATILREINKAFTGFSQRYIEVEEYKVKSCGEFEKGSSDDSEVDDFADQLVHRAIDEALEDLPFTRSGSYNLPVEVLQSVRSLVGTSSSSSGSTRSSLTSRSSRRGSSRRSSELSNSGNEEGMTGASGTGDIFRDPILEEEASEEEAEEDNEDREEEQSSDEVYGYGKESCPDFTARMSAPPILLQAPISDASKLSLSHEYLNLQAGASANPSPVSPAALASARLGARRNSSPMLLHQGRFEQRRSSIPSHIRLLPLSDSAKMAANSCGFIVSNEGPFLIAGLSRGGNSSESERLSVRSYRSWTSSCCGSGPGYSVDVEPADELDVWAEAFAQHSIRDALAEFGSRICVVEGFAEKMSDVILSEAVEEAKQYQPSSVGVGLVDRFADAMSQAIMEEAMSDIAEQRRLYDGFARRLSRRIVGKATRRAARRRERVARTFKKLEVSLSSDDLREFESRLSFDASLPTPTLDFLQSQFESSGKSSAVRRDSQGSKLPAWVRRRALKGHRMSLTREDSFYDALDIPYWLVEDYVDYFTQETMLKAEIDVFRRISNSPAMGIATGNWGCGAFKGDPQIKCLLQWIAASMCQSPILVYHTFGDSRVEKLPEVIELIRRQKMLVCDLYALVQDYCDIRRYWSTGTMELFDFIQDRLKR